MITMEICSGASASILLLSNLTGACIGAGENKKQTQIAIIWIDVTSIKLSNKYMLYNILYCDSVFNVAQGRVNKTRAGQQRLSLHNAQAKGECVI